MTESRMYLGLQAGQQIPESGINQGAPTQAGKALDSAPSLVLPCAVVEEAVNRAYPATHFVSGYGGASYVQTKQPPRDGQLDAFNSVRPLSLTEVEARLSRAEGRFTALQRTFDDTMRVLQQTERRLNEIEAHLMRSAH